AKQHSRRLGRRGGDGGRRLTRGNGRATIRSGQRRGRGRGSTRRAGCGERQRNVVFEPVAACERQRTHDQNEQQGCWAEVGCFHGGKFSTTRSDCADRRLNVR